MRAAIYARFSSERQSDTSLADQVRRGRERCAALGLTVVAEHCDDAISGSIPVAARAGGKALLADVLAGRIDVVVVEGLDRLSREVGEQERTVKRLEHRGLRIIGFGDGYDSNASGRKVMRLARGMINELYLDDLRAKTHRGLEGQVLRGHHAGGLSFGYRSVPAVGGHRLEIDEAQADVVRRILSEYAAGLSPRRIAHQLNADKVPSPRGGTWATSAIAGCPKKGSGIINNELYVGRYIWNRSQWIKDPDTGKRTRVDRPQSEWKIETRPELCIVDAELWAAVRARHSAGLVKGGRPKGGGPTTLFGGLLRCRHCGGAVVAIDAYRYGCAAKKDRGTCPGVTAKRKAVDARLLSAVRDDVLGGNALAHVRRQVRELLASAERDANQAARAAVVKREELQREVAHLVDAIATVGVSPALAERLRRAEAELASASDDAPGLARQVTEAEIDAAFRRLVMRLQDVLQGDVGRARSLLADLLGPITIERRGKEVWAEASIDGARLLAAAGGGSKMDAVAGARFSIDLRIWRVE